MWKLKFASKLAGGPSMPDIPGVKSTPKTNYHKYARWGGLGVSGLLVCLGLVAIFFNSGYIVGSIAVLEGLLVFVLELPLALGLSLRTLLNKFNDFKLKIIFFVVAGIPPFFNLATILAAIASIACGVAYGFCWWKGEQGEEIKEKSAKSAKAANEETNNKKKSGLASKGAAPGVV